MSRSRLRHTLFKIQTQTKFSNSGQHPEYSRSHTPHNSQRLFRNSQRLFTYPDNSSATTRKTHDETVGESALDADYGADYDLRDGWFFLAEQFLGPLGAPVPP